MTRFLNGLIHDIVNEVELQYFIESEEMIRIAIKVKRQQKCKSSKWQVIQVLSHHGDQIIWER
jgi:hypothetical protein